VLHFAALSLQSACPAILFTEQAMQAGPLHAPSGLVQGLCVTAAEVMCAELLLHARFAPAASVMLHPYSPACAVPARLMTIMPQFGSQTVVTCYETLCAQAGISPASNLHSQSISYSSVSSLSASPCCLAVVHL
jgi:hypothetical protein